jgi:putative DNA primase/helicase
MTGWTNPYFPTEVCERTDALREVCAKYMKPTSSIAPRYALRDTIRRGSRNNTLTSVAGSLRRRGASRDLILDLLTGTNKARCDPPLDDAEVRGIAYSIARYDPDESATGREYEYNDRGDAEYILDIAGNHIRHIHPSKPKEAGIWCAWDGTRWDHAGYGLSKATVRQGLERRASDLCNLAQTLDPEGAKAALRHAHRVGSSSKLDAVLKMLSTYEELQVSHEDFDNDPYALNCRNGIIDLRDGTLMPHDPAAYHSRIASVAYDSLAKAPRWAQFISDITAGEEELAAYLRRVAGYSLLGELSEHAFFMLVGTKRNGKTTFIESLKNCMGSYAVTVQVGAFMQRGPSDLNPDILKLRGARFCNTSETEGNQRMAAGLLKALTGGGTIAGRELYMGPIEFKPCAKLWIDTNNPPHMSPQDKGIWARAHIIPFDVCFEGREDKHLPEALSFELPGILSWAVQGAGEWMSEGLNPPSIVRDTTKRVKDEQDSMQGFLDEVCENCGEGKEQLKKVYDGYVAWCHDAGCSVLKKAEFIREMEYRGYEKIEGSGHMRYIKGVRMP